MSTHAISSSCRRLLLVLFIVVAALGVAVAAGCAGQPLVELTDAPDAPTRARERTATGSEGGGGDECGTEDAGPRASETDAASVCSSGTTWSDAAAPSEQMHPGRPCIACHSSNGGPRLAIGGTVFPSLHEPDDCNGVARGGLAVIVIDATGKTHTLPVNAAGNFLRVSALPLPYRAMIVEGTKVRVMRTPQTDGDCNGCHADTGGSAPGRVMVP
jgi:hypothetical protein